AKPIPVGVPAKGGEVDPAAVQAALPMVPGDETIWERYSPNGEPILSGFASLLLHGLMFLIILVGIGWLFSKSEPVLDELEPVEIGNGEEGGGGGSTEGVGTAPGNLSRPEDDQKSLVEDKTPKPMLPEEDVKVTKSKDVPEDPTDIVIEKMKDKQVAKRLGPVIKDALEGIAGAGKGGSGMGGGEGTGVGRGRG